MPCQQVKSRHSLSLYISSLIISSNSCSIFILWRKQLDSVQFTWKIYQSGGCSWKICLLSLSILIKARSFASVPSTTLSTRRTFTVCWHQPYEPLQLREGFVKRMLWVVQSCCSAEAWAVALQGHLHYGGSILETGFASQSRPVAVNQPRSTRWTETAPSLRTGGLRAREGMVFAAVKHCWLAWI